MLRPPAILLTLVVLTGMLSAPAEDVAIVHAGTALGELSEDALRDLFLGRTPNWPGGKDVVVAIMRSGPSHDRLLARLGRSSQQFQSAWKKLVFTGKAAMPTVFDSEDDLVAFVVRTPGAIGFVDHAKVKGPAKALPIK